jgi:DNA-directed RNA polymerase subunit beta'
MLTTVGRVLVNEALPEDMRDYTRVVDKKTMKNLLQQIADKRPDLYRDISHKFIRIGQSAAQTGNFSFSLKDFASPAKKHELVNELRQKVSVVVNNEKLSEEEKQRQIVELLGDQVQPMIQTVLDESHKSGSRLAELIKGESKGSPSQFNTTVGADLMF